MVEISEEDQLLLKQYAYLGTPSEIVHALIQDALSQDTKDLQARLAWLRTAFRARLLGTNLKEKLYCLLSDKKPHRSDELTLLGSRLQVAVATDELTQEGYTITEDAGTLTLV